MTYVVGAKTVNDFTTSRLKYNLEEAEVFEPAKNETQWLSFMLKVARLPVNASTFKSFSNTPSWIVRQFYAAGAGAWGTSNTITNLPVDDGAGNGPGFLVPGLLCRVRHASAANDTFFVIRKVNSQTSLDVQSVGPNKTDIADNDRIQIVGVGMGETSSAAKAVGSVLSTNTHYCQDFEHEWAMSTQATAENVFGPDEWTRLAAETLRIHKTDINRALLLGVGLDATSISIDDETVSVRLMDGFITFCENNSSLLMNSQGVVTPSYSTYTYNDFVDDMENLFALGSMAKAGICGSSVLAFFSKIGANSFLAGAGVQVQNAATSFGIDITKVRTPFGVLSLIWDKVLRGEGFYKDYMAVADLEYCKYRPLVGNGYNFDTHLLTNTQNPNQFRVKKNAYRTVAGSQYNTPAVHGLWKFTA